MGHNEETLFETQRRKIAWSVTRGKQRLSPECLRSIRGGMTILKSAGICNYTIWNVGDELFGYYECEKGVEFAARTQAESEIVDRWNEYMKDVMVMEMDPVTGAQPKLEQVFFLE